MPAMVKPSIHTAWPLKLLNGGSSTISGRRVATMTMPMITLSDRCRLEKSATRLRNPTFGAGAGATALMLVPQAVVRAGQRA